MQFEERKWQSFSIDCIREYTDCFRKWCSVHIPYSFSFRERHSHKQESFQDCAKTALDRATNGEPVLIGSQKFFGHLQGIKTDANMRMARFEGFRTILCDPQITNLRFASKHGTRFSRARHAKYDLSSHYFTIMTEVFQLSCWTLRDTVKHSLLQKKTVTVESLSGTASAALTKICERNAFQHISSCLESAKREEY